MAAIVHSNRRLVFTAGLCIIFCLLMLRIFQLQIYSKDRYLRESEQNRIRIVPIKATRGLLLDYKDNVLVDNRPSYSVSVIPFEVSGRDTVLTLLSDIMGMPVEKIKARMREAKGGVFTPVKVQRQIDFVQLARLEENRLDLFGVIFEVEPHRYYPFGSLASHAFGYLGEITSEELKTLRNRGYTLGDIIGKKGLEKQFERLLRGSKGFAYMEVDALGREVSTLSDPAMVPPHEGQNLQITLDVSLQKHIAQLMEGKRGAAIVLDCRNGEVLALVSKPSFNLDVFTGVISPEVWASLVDDPDKPLFDRTIQSVFPPGSAFKLILAAAALETKIITKDNIYFCPGSVRLGTRTFSCWKKEGHGPLDLLDAIEQSCNVYFYNLALQVGIDAWSRFAKNFGFGSPTGIDLPGESAGVVPDQKFLDKRYGKSGWTRGMLLNLAVGQGDLLVTPLQMAQMAMAIANNGVYYQPHLLRSVIEPSDGTVNWTRIQSRRVPEVSTETYQLLKKAMLRVVHAPHGTGRAAWVQGVGVSGKTGTAQNPHGADHAWFIGFAPDFAPKIAFCIFVENSGSGGAVAAPIARSFLQVYLQKEIGKQPGLVNSESEGDSLSYWPE